MIWEIMAFIAGMLVGRYIDLIEIITNIRDDMQGGKKR